MIITEEQNGTLANKQYIVNRYFKTTVMSLDKENLLLNNL
jgi:hypothetical protein